MATRWNIAVSPETDRSVRMYLAEQGRSKKGELSRFIEGAVRRQMFEQSAKAGRAATAGMSEDEIDDLIEEALAWARAQ